MDLKRRKIAQDYIDKWNRKSKTIIFATHDPTWALRYCTRILLIDKCNIKINQKSTQVDLEQIEKILK